MNSWTIAIVSFACMFFGSLIALLVARVLPERHVSKDTQDVVKLGVGMIAAMASLILGLMTASVKGGYDSTDKDLHQYALHIIALDSSLRHYGPAAVGARALVNDYTKTIIRETWPDAKDTPSPSGTDSSGQLLLKLDTAIRALSPTTEDQRELRQEAIARLNSIVITRWTVTEEGVTAIPFVFIVVLIVWLSLIFASFGLFAPGNAVVVLAMFLCSLSISGALFLIVEMGGPFDGVIQLQPTPLLDALKYMPQTSLLMQ
ncbi:bestrophin-like domain [Roseixanthobacter pseudopolyaromaticivorans]|uniref:bestrophin-like domain n=1 Tax=Xanthobacteraceae TaxID=335928 RepID=UPI0037299089